MRMRKEGLAGKGEFSVENLAFKRQTKGKLTCTKARALKSKQKNKGNNTAKAAQRYLNYHCEDTGMDCPAATQDLELNTKNRDATIKQFNYEHVPVRDFIYK